MSNSVRERGGGAPGGIDSAGPGGTAPGDDLRFPQGVAMRALAGLVAGALAVGIAQLVAVWTGGGPLLAVGSAVIDVMPFGLKEAAIHAFGTHDKMVFFVAMGIVIAALLAVAGVVESRRRPIGTILFFVAGAIGVIAAYTRADAGMLAPLASVVGVVVGVYALRQMSAKGRGERLAVDGFMARRSFLQVLGGSAVVAAASGIFSQLLTAGARRADASRASVVLPRPTSAVTIPAGADLKVPGQAPFITPNADFYRIDTALSVPRLQTTDWALHIHGMVEREVNLDFAELIALPLVEKDITLSCVSNEVGGDLIGNAVWLGYPIRELLAKAGVKPGADMVLSTSTDGFTAGTPLTALTDPDRDALLAVGMNGEPLPLEHGFPVRMVVPGLYGYVSATKWVVDLKVTTFADDVGYWQTEGWAVKGPIKLESRIDVPGPRKSLKAGKVPVAGVAWEPHTGVSKVEVQVDDGPWQPAKIGETPSTDTWCQWLYEWDATPGRHRLTVRATDRGGKVQTTEIAPPAPDGASGYHSISVDVGS